MTCKLWLHVEVNTSKKHACSYTQWDACGLLLARPHPTPTRYRLRLFSLSDCRYLSAGWFFVGCLDSLVALACYFVWVCWLACGFVRRLFCFKSIRALPLSPEFQPWSSKMNARVHCANRKLFGRVVLIILPAPQWVAPSCFWIVSVLVGSWNFGAAFLPFLPPYQTIQQTFCRIFHSTNLVLWVGAVGSGTSVKNTIWQIRLHVWLLANFAMISSSRDLEPT